MRFIFIILLIFCLPINVLSQNKVEMEHNGVAGVWFDEATVTKMTEDLTEFHILKYKKIPTLELKIEKLQMNIETLELELKVTEKLAKKWEEQALAIEDLRVSEVERLQTKLDAKQKWYNSPPTYLITGILLGGLCAVGLNFGLQGAR